MMTLEAALARSGARIAAWDRSSGNANLLSIVAVDRTSAKVIARGTVRAAERAALDKRMALLGILPGGTYRACDYAWSFGESHGAIVKLDAGIEAEAIGSDIVVRGRRIRIASIHSVVSFVDEGDIAHRGVKLLLVNREEAIVAEETDPTPSIDPTYGRANLEIDAGWIVFLARELAARLGVTHRDELWDTDTPPQAGSKPHDQATAAFLDGLIDAYEHWEDPDRVAKRAARQSDKDRRDAAILDLAYIESGQRGDAPMDVAVAKMADHFAQRIEHEVPEIGAFSSIYQPLPEIENGGYIALDLKPLEGGRRALELRVESPSGENKAHEILREGTRGELVDFLRSVSLSDEILPLMEKLTDATRET